MSIYRDSLAGLAFQVSTKRAVVVSRDQELSPVLRALLPSRLREALATLRPRALAEGDTIEKLSDADAALDAMLALYDEGAQLGPKLRESSDDVADPAPPAMSAPWLMEEANLIAFRNAFSARVLELAPDTFLARFGDYAYISRFRIAGAPFAVVVKADIHPDLAGVTRFEIVVRTSVPPTLASLVLRPEGLHHVVGKALHVVREIETGDPELDSRFWITGAPETSAVFTPAVRAALVELADLGPVLRLGNGMATLSWTGMWHHHAKAALPDVALDVLVALRLAVETG